MPTWPPPRLGDHGADGCRGFRRLSAGRQIEILAGDHQAKPDVGSTLVDPWIYEDGVDVIADIPASSVLRGIQEIGRRKNNLVLASAGGSADFSGKTGAPLLDSSNKKSAPFRRAEALPVREAHFVV